MSKLNKLTISGIYIALFIISIGLIAGISFGMIQVRMANALYAIPYLYPFLVIPAGIAVAMSNLMFGGLGLIDVLGGFVVAVTTTTLIASVRRLNARRELVIIPIIVIPSLIVPIWLAPIVGLPYLTFIPIIALGHIPPALLGYLLVSTLENKLPKDLEEK